MSDTTLNRNLFNIIYFRDRYTPRVLAAMVDSVVCEFKKRKEKLLSRHKMEWESSYMLQVTEWLLRAQCFDREYLGKNIDYVSEEYVPKVDACFNKNFSLTAEN